MSSIASTHLPTATKLRNRTGGERNSDIRQAIELSRQNGRGELRDGLPAHQRHRGEFAVDLAITKAAVRLPPP